MLEKIESPLWAFFFFNPALRFPARERYTTGDFGFKPIGKKEPFGILNVTRFEPKSIYKVKNKTNIYFKL
ncbi:MAG: hypothetical protein IJ852_01265 [Alphaproteobacteria bacterium]|nr:hypothetical protein [Alphaproteobacteria bacterium]